MALIQAARRSARSTDARSTALFYQQTPQQDAASYQFDDTVETKALEGDAVSQQTGGNGDTGLDNHPRE